MDINNGYLVQWGTGKLTSSSNTLTLPCSYQIYYVVSALINGITSANVYTIRANITDLSYFQYCTNASTNFSTRIAFYWMSVGF